jgi:sialate O-acetylesterase
MRLRLVVVLAGLALVAPGRARADVRPHALCSEGMVLQQKGEAKVWGTADPGEEVTVAFRGQQARAKADDKGNWVAVVKTGEAGGPFDMTIAGKNEIRYQNVLVGEVWVCSGQSNMEWPVGACDASDKDTAFSSPANPMLRMFQVAKTPTAKPITETKGKWVESDPKAIGGWTAVGYFFGRDLQQKLKVPVGLIQSAWGGTRAEAWTSPDALAASPAFKGEIDAFLQKMEDPEKKAAFDAKPGARANDPSVLYNGMIAPLLNYRIRGAIWYQGESNTGNAFAYRTLFPMMIQDWRTHWNQPDFPFYFVQLAPFTPIRKEPGPSSWALLRESQLVTEQKLPNTGMAVITDYGDEADIHPTPKKPVGDRLALIARAKTYGEKVEYSGPLYKGLSVQGNKAVLSFDHVGGGLVSEEMVPTRERKGKTGQVLAAWRAKKDTEGAPLIGFTVCGKDQVFHPAKAEIVGQTVVVTCDAVPEPVAVRYGWADHPLCNLFNRDGLPATPFRTDDFGDPKAPKQ